MIAERIEGEKEKEKEGEGRRKKKKSGGGYLGHICGENSRLLSQCLTGRQALKIHRGSISPSSEPSLPTHYHASSFFTIVLHLILLIGILKRG